MTLAVIMNVLSKEQESRERQGETKTEHGLLTGPRSEKDLRRQTRHLNTWEDDTNYYTEKAAS